MKTWIQTSKELVFQSFLFRHFRVGFRSEHSRKEGHFDVLETKDWVNVVPFTNDDQVVMVRQFRFGSNELSLEFPAGAIEPGEAPEKAARRELLEETGSEGQAVWASGECRPNPAFLNNRCYHFVAEGVEFRRAQALDEFEEIEFVLVPVEEVDALIRGGKISHALSIAAWHYCRARREE